MSQHDASHRSALVWNMAGSGNASLMNSTTSVVQRSSLEDACLRIMWLPLSCTRYALSLSPSGHTMIAGCACDCLQAVQSVELQRKLATERQLQQKQTRSSELRSAHIKQIQRKALDETTKVHEVLFINKLQNKDKELTLMQRLQVSC